MPRAGLDRQYEGVLVGGSGGSASIGPSTPTSFTTGQVVFAGTGVLATDAAFFWDNVGKRLGIGAAPTSFELEITKSTVGSNVDLNVHNTDNTNAGSGALIQALVGGGAAGDAYAIYGISAGQNYALGLDNSDADKFKIAGSTALGTTDRFTIDTGGNIGLGTTAPNVKADVNGAIAYRNGSVALVNGANQDVNIPANTYVRVTGPSAVYSIGGFQNGFDGRSLLLVNTVAFALTINNNDAGSGASNRITTLTGANVTLRAGLSFASFIYDSTGGTWILVATN
jgi:hypothetical protein